MSTVGWLEGWGGVGGQGRKREHTDVLLIRLSLVPVCVIVTHGGWSKQLLCICSHQSVKLYMPVKIKCKLCPERVRELVVVVLNEGTQKYYVLITVNKDMM